MTPSNLLSEPTDATPSTVDSHWRAWLHDRSQVARDELVARYSELVRILAAKTFRRRFSQELEYGDYAQFGMIGLLEAIDRFDPAMGIKFETFASHRVQGAILNGVESLSEKQQQIAARRRVRAERASSLAAGTESGGPLSSAQALHRLADVAVGLALGFMLDDAGMYLDGEPASGDTPYEQVELAQLRQRVAQLADRLPVQERKVIQWHYFQRLRFEEIASSLQLTKGRVSQIHHAGLRRLRELHALSEDFSMTT